MAMLHLNRYQRKRLSKRRDRGRVIKQFGSLRFCKTEADVLAHNPDFRENSRVRYSPINQTEFGRFRKGYNNRMLRHAFRGDLIGEDDLLPDRCIYKKYADYRRD